MQHSRVLITGGARGIGRALVEAFAAAGCRVCFTYHQSAEAARALAGLALPIHADLSDSAGCAIAAQKALDALGHIDILVNNAGVSQQKLFTDITNDDWQQMMAVNLSAPFYLTRALLPDMIRRRQGRIINISSMWGVCGASCEVHYSAAKAGLIGMTRALAAEVAPSGITVNAVAPGVIDTDMYRMLGPETMSLVLDDIPVGRVGIPADVVRAVLFLADDGAGFITGQVLGVNGGMVI